MELDGLPSTVMPRPAVTLNFDLWLENLNSMSPVPRYTYDLIFVKIASIFTKIWHSNGFLGHPPPRPWPLTPKSNRHIYEPKHILALRLHLRLRLWLSAIPVEPPLAVKASLLLRPQSGTARQKQSVLQHLFRCPERHWIRNCSRDPTPTNSITNCTNTTHCSFTFLFHRSFWTICHVNVNSLTNICDQNWVTVSSLVLRQCPQVFRDAHRLTDSLTDWQTLEYRIPPTSKVFGGGGIEIGKSCPTCGRGRVCCRRRPMHTGDHTHHTPRVHWPASVVRHLCPVTLTLTQFLAARYVGHSGTTASEWRRTSRRPPCACVHRTKLPASSWPSARSRSAPLPVPLLPASPPSRQLVDSLRSWPIAPDPRGDCFRSATRSESAPLLAPVCRRGIGAKTARLSQNFRSRRHSPGDCCWFAEYWRCLLYGYSSRHAR